MDELLAPLQDAFEGQIVFFARCVVSRSLDAPF